MDQDGGADRGKAYSLKKWTVGVASTQRSDRAEPLSAVPFLKEVFSLFTNFGSYVEYAHFVRFGGIRLSASENTAEMAPWKFVDFT